MTFDDAYLNGGQDPYQYYPGVTITNTRLGTLNQVVAGSGYGDPGNWDMAGTNGSVFLATNQSTNVMTFAYDQAVSLTTLDVGSAGPWTGSSTYNFQAVAFLGATQVGTFNVDVIAGTRVADGPGYWNTLTLSGVTFDSFQLSQTGSSAWGVDNVQVDLVPEPGSLAVLSFGGLCMLRRRRG